MSSEILVEQEESRSVGLIGREGEGSCLVGLGRDGVLVGIGGDAVEHIGVDEENVDCVGSLMMGSLAEKSDFGNGCLRSSGAKG